MKKARLTRISTERVNHPTEETLSGHFYHDPVVKQSFNLMCVDGVLQTSTVQSVKHSTDGTRFDFTTLNSEYRLDVFN